ncbi:hypothetical protein [Bradyrhizobium japonicum]|uniref:hypothetical protein n=1 Tax=Bradyrhizobium japonicum TaxID=375 RepID=UPI00209CF223|nr:hypothetical protein [Bradyrhizobium japonicum]MCP1765397.1 hypothetical protein [Bradyrhizobium japonicum]MCP1787535.1 hypothetical protein [Bradyrhizobium japonicum]MCP1809411.1 hypothetical protein [Bradyrhizobium japonicum]MCP1818344.1 hypothetical protein [Bradyrhizobium japonicum]MCP1870146.1 hypothetical protein [Bradyrhizobium japonicum]
MSTVTVYKVFLYEPQEDEPLVSRRMATRAGAVAMCGIVIEGTGCVIDATDLETGKQWTALDFDPVAAGREKTQPNQSDQRATPGQQVGNL